MLNRSARIFKAMRGGYFIGVATVPKIRGTVAESSLQIF